MSRFLKWHSFLNLALKLCYKELCLSQETGKDHTLIHSLALISHVLKDSLNLQAEFPSQVCSHGKPPDLVGFAREQRIHLVLFRWSSPPKQLAVPGWIICDSSNASLPVTKKRGIFAGEIPLLTPAKVPLDCPEWRMDAIAEPLMGGPCLSSNIMSWCTWGLPDLVCSVTPTVISLLSGFLVFDCVFHGPCWGLLAGCSHGVCCSFPEVLSLK